jgi:hypothetical protein
MEEMSFEYWNKLSNHIIVISSLLGGFSITVIANFLVSETNTRLSRVLLKTSVLAASLFLVTVFTMTKIFMITTKGYPIKVDKEDIFIPSIISGFSFLLGITSLMTMISLSGWTKSKNMGVFTTIIGIISFIIILIMLT